MNLKASFWYALKILNPPTGKNSTGRRSLLGAIFCIALSLVPLVVVQTVADGMISGITSRIVELSSYHAAAYYPYKIATDSLDYQINQLEKTRNKIQKIDGVTGAFIEASGTALAAGINGRSGAQIRAVNNRLFTDDASFMEYINIIEGTVNLSELNSTIIGEKIASDLGLHVGDFIRLIGATTNSSGTVIPKVKMFKVTGIISSGYEELDALWVFVPLQSGMEFLAGSNAQTKIGIETDDAFTSSFTKTTMQISPILQSGWGFYTWKQLNASQYENFSSTRILLLLIMFLILLIASVNISSAIVMIVMERRGEIAILKSMGASPAGITSSFIICGTLCGIGGVLLGLPLGLICAVNVNEILHFIEKTVNDCAKFLYLLVGKENYVSVELLNPAYYLDKIPITIPFMQLFVIVLGTIVLSMIVSFLPSIHAGKEKPLSIFRKM